MSSRKLSQEWPQWRAFRAFAKEPGAQRVRVPAPLGHPCQALLERRIKLVQLRSTMCQLTLCRCHHATDSTPIWELAGERRQHVRRPSDDEAF